MIIKALLIVLLFSTEDGVTEYRYPLPSLKVCKEILKESKLVGINSITKLGGGDFEDLVNGTTLLTCSTADNSKLSVVYSNSPYHIDRDADYLHTYKLEKFIQ
jgi:hypothetical protein